MYFLEQAIYSTVAPMVSRKLTSLFVCLFVCLELIFLLPAQNQTQTLHLNNQLYSSQPCFPHSGETHDQWL